jgi:putative membrane-bound dehydrogenase-like protein
MVRVVFALLVCVSVSFAQKEFGFDNRKGSGQAYLKPDETVAKFKVPAEFEVKLFAGEPDCVNPVAFSIDEKGRVWVLECFEYPSKTPKGKAPRDRIVILEDTDGDGKCDKRTVFCEGKDFPVPEARKKAGLGAFDLATGLEIGHGKAYVGAPPYLWEVEISKDDKPGKFTPVLSGFGSEDTHETLNTFQWGPDGWLYGMQGVFTQSNVKSLDGPETRMNAAVWRYHPKTQKFEIYAEGTSNPWGMDWRNTDGQFILACCVIPHLYHIVPGGIYKRQAGASYNPYSYGYINEISDHTFHKESGWAHAGLISLDVPHMPERFRNSVIFGSIHGCSLKQNILKPKGSSYVASRGDDFLTSGDKNFRPINLKWGPHGDIYLIDWHDQMPCHQAKADEWDYSRGRVYRIQLKDRKGGKPEDLGKWTPKELMNACYDPNDPYRMRIATRLLERLTEDEFKQGVMSIKHDPSELGASPLTRITAARGGLEAYLPHPEDSKAFAAMAVVPNGLVELHRLIPDARIIDGAVIGELTKTATYQDVRIRRELASAAIRLADKHDVTELLHALMKNKDDANDPLIPHLVWIAYEKVLASGGRESPVSPEKNDKKNQGVDTPRSPKMEDELAFLAKEAPDNIFVRDQIVPKVMRRLVATGKPEHLALCLKFLTDVKDLNSRQKALDGLSIALAGQTVDAPKGWAELQPELRKEAKLVPLVNKLAVSFRDPEAVKRALGIVKLSSDSGQVVEGLRQLGQLKGEDSFKAIRSWVGNGGPVEAQVEAARQLGNFNKPELAKELLGQWSKLPAPVRVELVNTFAGRQVWAIELMKAVQAKTVERTELTDNTITKMDGFRDKALSELIEKAWGRTRPTPAELNKLIDKTRDSLNTKTASFSSGKKVFEAQCSKCHKFEGVGHEVGPNIEGAGRDIEYLLANVLDPNRVIGAPYFVRTANLLDGQAIQGILHEEDDQFITLKIENAVLKKIKKTDLDGPVKLAEKSIMPEGLSAGMSEQDFRDLVRYVMASPYIVNVTVNGTAVQAPLTGIIQLPKEKGEVTVSAKFSAAKSLRTKLLVEGVAFNTDAELDGKKIGDNSEIAAGEHTLVLKVQNAGGSKMTVRFLDPDRLLSYPEK